MSIGFNSIRKTLILFKMLKIFNLEARKNTKQTTFENNVSIISAKYCI